MKRTKLILLTILIIISLFHFRALAVSDDTPVGSSAELLVSSGDVDSRLEETSLGNIAADAALFVSDADIAIINGGAFCANLTGGDVTYGDCVAVFKEDLPLYTVSVSVSELRSLLEFCVSHARVTRDEYLDRENSIFDYFPQISGFAFLYDLSAPSGDRIVWIRYKDQELDLSDEATILRLCTTAPILSDSDCAAIPQQTTHTVSSALVSYFSAHDGPVQSPSMDRIQTRGSNENSIFDSLNLSPLLLLVAVVCFGAAGSSPFKKHYDFKR